MVMALQIVRKPTHPQHRVSRDTGASVETEILPSWVCSVADAGDKTLLGLELEGCQFSFSIPELIKLVVNVVTRH